MNRMISAKQLNQVISAIGVTGLALVGLSVALGQNAAASPAASLLSLHDPASSVSQTPHAGSFGTVAAGTSGEGSESDGSAMFETAGEATAEEQGSSQTSSATLGTTSQKLSSTQELEHAVDVEVSDANATVDADAEDTSIHVDHSSTLDDSKNKTKVDVDRSTKVKNSTDNDVDNDIDQDISAGKNKISGNENTGTINQPSVSVHLNGLE